MRKFWLLTTLLVGGLLLTGCNKLSTSDTIYWSTVNEPESNEIISWWYLYKNLDLTKEEDKAEYEALQQDKNMILKYQTDTSASVNKFIDIIHDDLLESCEQYWTGYETMKWTMYERDVCVDNYIKDLYEKLKAELNNPRIVYLWDDPVLLSYYNDLNWDHPFVRYFVDLYEFIKNQWYRATWMMPEYPIKAPLSENPDWWYWWDEEKWRELYSKNKTWFYTYWEWNITRTERGDYISVIASWIVFNGNMLEWIQNEYWYTFPYYTDAILQWTSPERWPIVLHQNDWYNDYIYQIISEWGGSWEFYILVWILKDWLRIPIWECWYMLFPTYPMLFGECKEWSNFEPLTILTQEWNSYEWNSIEDMANNFTFFLRLLESTRVLNK